MQSDPTGSIDSRTHPLDPDTNNNNDIMEAREETGEGMHDTDYEDGTSVSNNNAKHMLLKKEVKVRIDEKSEEVSTTRTKEQDNLNERNLAWPSSSAGEESAVLETTTVASCSPELYEEPPKMPVHIGPRRPQLNAQAREFVPNFLLNIEPVATPPAGMLYGGAPALMPPLVPPQQLVTTCPIDGVEAPPASTRNLLVSSGEIMKTIKSSTDVYDDAVVDPVSTPAVYHGSVANGSKSATGARSFDAEEPRVVFLSKSPETDTGHLFDSSCGEELGRESWPIQKRPSKSTHFLLTVFFL